MWLALKVREVSAYTRSSGILFTLIGFQFEGEMEWSSIPGFYFLLFFAEHGGSPEYATVPRLNKKRSVLIHWESAILTILVKAEWLSLLVRARSMASLMYAVAPSIRRPHRFI
jgi:hypothetical protein